MSITKHAGPLILSLYVFLSFTDAVAEESKNTTLVTLGQLLFFDQNLSKNGNQSCSSCHNPSRAFIDTRANATNAAVSAGDDETSLGTRNTPSISYASLTPAFSVDKEGYIGGLFLDGRAKTLPQQALDPFVNPLEMALPSHTALANKVRSNPSYKTLLETLSDNKQTGAEKQILTTIGEALAAFQRSEHFNTFDSKYDRFLAGKAELSDLEERGRSLFFSQLANCSQCHMLNTATVKANETFSNYRYHNIGVPPNEQAARLATDQRALPDLGLFNNPAVNSALARGKFKVPSLRNVAVTGPYMHNGVFRKLETAVHFYNQFIVQNPETKTNPETGKPWLAPEVEENVSTDILRQGQPMDKQRIAAIVAFLKTLTDKRYEALLE